MATANELVSQGFGGYQGWGDAEAAADFAATGGSGKKSGGGASIDVPSIADYSEQAYAPADEALKSYVMALRGQAKPLDVYGQLESAAGLPQMKQTATTLREQIGTLEDSIRRAEGNVNATTKESYVTEGQRAGMIEARRKPLIENLSTLTTGLGRISEGITAASADLSTKISLFMQGQTQALKPFEVQLAAANDKAARAVTGYTADVQNQLTTAMAKWQRQNELDDREVEQAFEMLKLENGYTQQLAQMMEQSKINISEYETQKQIDKKYKTPVDNSIPDVDPYYGDEDYYNTNDIESLWNSA